MKRFAIDVVLLPPDPVMDLALELNRKLCQGRPDNIALGRSRRIPHISMLMGCIRNDQLSEAAVLLKSVAAKYYAPDVNVEAIRTFDTPSGNRVVTLDIQVTPDLTALHESIVSAFRPLVSQDTDEAAIDDIPPISRDAIDWINNFIPDQCFKNFWPHITLGFGDAPFDFKPINFRGVRLAICHLGNYCTCSAILSETELKSA